MEVRGAEKGLNFFDSMDPLCSAAVIVSICLQQINEDNIQ